MKRIERSDFRALPVWVALLPPLLAGSAALADPGRPAIGRQTLGGLMLFSDEVVCRDWRIQKNAVTGGYRLIDPNDRVVATADYQRCLEKLETIKKQNRLAPLPKKVVLVLHGLGAYRKYMAPLSTYLEVHGGLTVVNVGYPSTMGPIGEHADTLANVIQHLDGVETISVVAHSMGNIVIRHYLGDLESIPKRDRPQVTYKRFVMIAPPNHGAAMAGKVTRKQGLAKLAQLLGGKAVEQLAPNQSWPTLEPRLATPKFEFGIIVGGQGDNRGYLAAIPGDDDMLLSIATSKLAGASDFVQVKNVHATLPKNRQVQSYALRYLQTGAFLAAGKRHPITADDTAKANSP